jgi:hypothetical protein
MAIDDKLTELFARLGAQDPDRWARSQIDEGIPQLARFLFLQQAWKLVVSEGDLRWIESESRVPSGQPGGAIGSALARVLDQHVDPKDLTTIVRVMQWQLLTKLCYLLDDPGDLETEVENIAWRLFQVDEHDQPVAIMGELHESVLETDPSGKEMRS